MIIAIDESGTHRQSGYSVIALVCVMSSDALNKLDCGVIELEKTIGITSFHWAYKGWPFRRDFIKGLNKFDFSIRLVQLNNPTKLNDAMAETLPYIISEQNIECLFIDGKKPKQYERMLKKVLRDKNITIKKIKTVNDTAYPSIRVADAVAGAVRYHLDNPTREATKIFKAIEPKIEFIHVDNKKCHPAGGQFFR